MTEKKNLEDSYKLYKKAVARQQGRINESAYLKIVGGFMKFFMEKVLEGFTVRMGAKLGVIGVKGKQSHPIIVDNGNGEEVKGLAPNWGKTKIVWQADAEKRGLDFQTYIETVPREQRPSLVYCFNEHSNGHIYNILWHKDKVIVANKTYYNLKFTRTHKRALSRLIFEGKEYDINETA